jgi:hypothetical protein
MDEQPSAAASAGVNNGGARGFSRTARTVAALDGAADRAWFLPAVSAFPLADYVFPFLPNQMLLVALCILQPARWWQFALTFVLAGALGAVLTTLAVQTVGPAVLETFFADALEGGAPPAVMAMVEQYGLWALALLGMLPWPPRTAVLVCALAGLSPAAIGLAVAAGRIVPSAAYSLLGAKAPRLLRRFRSIEALLGEVETLRSVKPRR